jgi:hypothetical protein
MTLTYIWNATFIIERTRTVLPEIEEFFERFSKLNEKVRESSCKNIYYRNFIQEIETNMLMFQIERFIISKK